MLFAIIATVHVYSIDYTGQKIDILSPNAESFKIFGDIPVSLYTGIPQISIPLDNIKTDCINLNFNLNYHASGFKPQNHPSWVGLGWNLNVGGVITREVRGIPDENNSTSFPSPDAGIGFYFSHSSLDKEKWYIPEIPADRDPQLGFRNMDIDRQPDIFNFTFLGYSGKFCLDHKGSWKIESDTPLKVIFDKQDIQTNELFLVKHIRKFTIIDERGIKYIFGGEDAIEYSQPILPPNYNYNYWAATSWFLKEIIPPIGEAITFNYERGPYQSSISSSGKSPAILREYYANKEVAHNYILRHLSGTIISPVYLQSISCPANDLIIEFETAKSSDLSYFETNYTDFFYSEDGRTYQYRPEFLGFDMTKGIPYFERNMGDKNKAEVGSGSGKLSDRFIWLKLNKIKFKYGDKLSKTVVLNYHENTSIRRKLSSVDITYPNSTAPEIYTLEYNQNLPPDMAQEPEYLSEITDHWGYANNKYLWKEEDRTSSPKLSTTERAKLNVLSKIIYPTKGYSMFFFENHDYSSYVSNVNWTSILERCSMEIAGGLRIRKIINVDDTGKYTQKEYTYKNTKNVSSGILHYKPTYYFTNQLLFNNSGAHIGYSSITEKNLDGSIKNALFTSEESQSRLGEDVPSIMDDNPVYNNGSWEGAIPYSNRDIERGKISDEYYCDSTGRIYQSTHYKYINIGKDASNYIRTLDPDYMLKQVYDRESGVVYRTGAVAYYIYCYSNKIQSKRDVRYNASSSIYYGNTSKPSGKDAIIETREWEYDNLGQISKEILINSTGKKVSRNITYPYTSSTLNVHNEMVNRNMLNYPLEETDFSGNTLIKGTKFTYELLFDKYIMLTSVNNIFSDKSTSLNSKYKYNTLGKIIQITDNSDYNQSYLWDYKGRRLKMQIANLSIDELSKNISTDVINCSSTKVNWETTLSDINTKYPKSHSTYYDYNVNGSLNKIVGATGGSKGFTYDNNERLQSTQIAGNKVQEYSYNLKKSAPTNNLFFNEYTVVSAYKQCPAGFASEGKAELSVPAGIYMSKISQQDANKQAYNSVSEKIQELANNKGKCIRTQEVKLKSTLNTDIQTYRAYIYGDTLVISYIYFSWTDNYRYNGNKPHGTIAVAEIEDKEFIPEHSGRQDIELMGCTWSISIEGPGQIVIYLKEYKYPNQVPTWEEGFQISGEIKFPLK